MAARNGRKTKTRRRRNNNFNLLKLAESAAYGSVMTKAAFGSGLGYFLFKSDPSDGVTTLDELIRDPASRLEMAGQRLADPDVVIDAMAKFVALGIGFKLFTKLTSTPRRKVNSAFKMIGLPVAL
jgi:hypothetical protein